MMPELTDAAWCKSSFSGSSGCVEVASTAWHKSSYSQTADCVEVATTDNTIAVRDSKDRNGPVLMFNHAEWNAFVEGVRDGEFDLTSSQR